MRKIAALISILALAAVACSSGEPPPAVIGRDVGGDVELALGSATLQRFDECGELLDYVKDEVGDSVGPYGLEGNMGGDVFLATGGAEGDMATEDSAAVSAPAPATGGDGSAARQSATAFSETNVQVQGVDEPDIVKTDGELMAAVGQGRVQILDVTGEEPRRLSEIDLRETGWNHQLLLDGDRLVILTAGVGGAMPTDLVIEGGGDAARPGIGMAMPESTVLTVVDLADPTNPQTVSTVTLEGGYLSARMIDGIVRVVTRSTPMAIPFEYPVDDSPAATARAEEANKALVEEMTVEDWLPSYSVEGDGSSSSGQLVACDQVHHPVEFAGPGTLTVVTVDPADPKPGNAVSVLAGGDTVYASAGALYVATTNWQMPQDGSVTTQIHKFDISDPATSRYIGSGAVEGTLLNQFAMDELDGNLRVATTSFGPQESESFVSVLTERDGQLVQIGKVGGLGRTEQIYSVRFIGELGYVVTFRQTDPLYVIDLSDPTAPAVRGELKILGYSAYLHPIGDDLLLGVGQDATDEGRVQGTQLAVFDVSDPANPRRTHQLRIDGASSDAEYDHHAFLYWPETGLTVLPIQIYGPVSIEPLPAPDTPTSDGPAPDRPDVASPPPAQPWLGAIAFDVDPGSGITEQGRITHMRSAEDYLGQIRRSVVVDDALFTLSEAGVMASDLGTLDQRAFVPFPAFEAP